MTFGLRKAFMWSSKNLILKKINILFWNDFRFIEKLQKNSTESSCVPISPFPLMSVSYRVMARLENQEVNVSVKLLTGDFTDSSPVQTFDFEENSDRTLSIYKNSKIQAKKGPEGQLATLPVLESSLQYPTEHLSRLVLPSLGRRVSPIHFCQ